MTATIRPRFLAAMLALSACATAAPAMAKPPLYAPTGSDRELAREVVAPHPEYPATLAALAHTVAVANSYALDDLDETLGGIPINRGKTAFRGTLLASNEPAPSAAPAGPPPPNVATEAPPAPSDVSALAIPTVDPASLPIDPTSIDTIAKVANAAVASGNWTLVMVLLLLVILFFGERALAPKIPFLQTSLGVTVITVTLAALGGIAVALTGGGTLTAAVAVKAIVAALFTAGAFLSPTVAAAKVVQAEKAGAAALADKPSPGVDGIA